MKIIVDNELIEKSFERYAPMLLRIAYQDTQNQADAEDAVQFAFMKMLEKRDFEDENNIIAWLIRVTINKTRNIVLSPWRKRNAQFKEDMWATPDYESMEILDAVKKLPKKYGTCVYLHYYEGYTIKEIARLLGENENTIGSRLIRARKKLIPFLKEDEQL